MKKIFIIIIFFLISACKMISFNRYLSEEEFITHTNVPLDFELDNNDKILINVDFDGTNSQMIFDTRATSILFKNKDNWTDTLPELAAPKIFMRSKVASGQRIEGGFAQIRSAQCDIFTVKNWLVSTIDQPKINCNNSIGIFGHDDLSLGTKKERKILKIDFDKQKLMLINEMPEGWIKIKSKFFLGYVKIFLVINSIEYPFGFDTGFNGSIIFAKKDKNPGIDELQTKTIKYGQIFQVAGGENINDTIEIKNAPKVFFNDSCFVENSDIIFTDKIMENLVGIKLIKNYNWIISYKEKAVYIQQRKMNITKEESYLSEYIGVTFDFDANSTVVKTLSMSGRAEKSGLKIGDKILSLNNINILNIPQCEREEKIQEILKNTNKIVFKIKRHDKTKNISIE